MWKGAVARADSEAEQRLEVALCAAWHMAAFNSMAKVGKLEGWEVYRAKVFAKKSGAKPVPKPEDWRLRKSARKEQMDQLKRHLQQRKGGVRVPRVHHKDRGLQRT